MFGQVQRNIPEWFCQFVCLYRFRKWLTSFQFLLNSTQVGSRITNVSSLSPQIAELAINVTTLWDAVGGRGFCLTSFAGA